MKIGLNLSFAVKRWLEPPRVAAMVRDDFRTKYVQFTLDLVDPWWPAEERDRLACRWGEALRAHGLVVGGTFAGLAAYTYPQLLAPTPEQRRIAVEFFKRAIDMTAAMGLDCIGSPLGGMTHADAYDEVRRRAIYAAALDLVRELADYARRAGLKKILVEPTPLFTEFPSEPYECVKLMKDLEGTAVPVRLLIDWGHALFEPLLKGRADMDVWLDACLPYVDSFHLQQTDGQLDRHWGFTKPGKVTPELIREVMERHGAEDRVQYVELIYPFEVTDAFVYEDVRQTMRRLQEALGEGAG